MSSTLQPSEDTSSTPLRRTQEFNTAKALELRFKGLTYEAIGAVLCPEDPYTPQTVQGHLQRFQRFIANPQDVLAFESTRTQMLTALELEMMRSLADESCIEKASLNNRAYAFKQIHEARRLESGQSTSNLGVLTKHIQAVDGNLFDSQQEKKAAKQRMDTGD